MSERKIINMHQHHGGSLENIETIYRISQELGIVKTVLLGVSETRAPGYNDLVLEAARRYPDFYVPFAGFDFYRLDVNDVEKFYDQGFVGLKFSGPLLPYNDFRYFPIYEKAEKLGMPILFHLGIVSNSKIWRDCDCSLMRPVYLDHIARAFPNLILIGAHFGNPWSDEAAMACRWNPNLYFDLSGSLLKYRKPEYLGNLLWWTPDGPYRSPDNTYAWQKIVFGADVSADMIYDVINDYQKLMDALQLTEELREYVWWKTADKILQSVSK